MTTNPLRALLERRGPRPVDGEANTIIMDPVAPSGGVVDLRRRRDQLSARVAELQWDLGGLTYEMAVRDCVRVELLVQRAAELQAADAELGEVERLLRLEETGAAGACLVCRAPHSSGAVYCWQCGAGLLEQVPSSAIVPVA